ncbi:MAG: GNAT family N-acetyltransferase [Micropepsaceae bacterium]
MKIDLQRGADAPRDAIHEGLLNHNRKSVNRPEPQNFSLVVREGETIAGGINATVHWDVLFIEHVWLSEALRGQGLGRKLMAEAEAEGVRLGAVKALLDTNDWQAPGFYAKLGYTRIGVYTYDGGSKECILLVKEPLS